MIFRINESGNYILAGGVNDLSSRIERSIWAEDSNFAVFNADGQSLDAFFGDNLSTFDNRIHCHTNHDSFLPKRFREQTTVATRSLSYFTNWQKAEIYPFLERVDSAR